MWKALYTKHYKKKYNIVMNKINRMLNSKSMNKLSVCIYYTDYIAKSSSTLTEPSFLFDSCLTQDTVC